MFNVSSSFSADATTAEAGGACENSTPTAGFYRVVRTGIYVSGLTNGMTLNGEVTFPMEIGAITESELVDIVAQDNTSPLIGSSVETNEAGIWTFHWDTALVPNGTHNISLIATFADGTSMTNQAVTLTVSNYVSFPNYFTRIFGNQMWVYAELAFPEAECEIALYDENNNYLGSFFETTYDGTINFTWDLTDGGGYTFTNESFRGDFYITPLGSGLSAAAASGPNASVKWGKEAGWQEGNYFVVAWGAVDDSSVFQNNSLSKAINKMVPLGVVDPLGVESGDSENREYLLSAGNTVGAQTAAQLGSTVSRRNLLDSLSDPAYRHFYFFGHGSSESIAAFQENTRITAGTIRANLRNHPLAKNPTNAHPYRLVFLDGCETGRGTMCEAFGIPAQPSTRAFFQGQQVPARAFIGFKEEVTLSAAGFGSRQLALKAFFENWRDGVVLSQCLALANSAGFTGFTNNIVVYGASDLVRGGNP